MSLAATLLVISSISGGGPLSNLGTGNQLIGQLATSNKISIGLQLQLQRLEPPPAEIAANLEFVQQPNLEQLRDAEVLGVRFDRIDGRRAHIGRFYGVHLPTRALADVAALPFVNRVFESAPWGTEPATRERLEGQVPVEVRAEPSWWLRDAEGQRLLGQGAVICDIDRGIDVFQLGLFRADGGLYSWVDADRDGAFTPGIDGVDLDHNGDIGSDEVLLVIGGESYDASGSIAPPPEPFRADFSWLYIDGNENRVRDVGRAAGFTDASPGFGELAFIVDDINDDDRLNIGEKLLLLGTSKLRGVFRLATGQTYVRGENLIDAPGPTYSAHATMTAGVLVGGTFPHSTVMGIAPQAELLILERSGAESASWSYVTGAAWARTMGATIFLHEYGAWLQHDDGSGPFELLVDELTEAGIPNVTAAGNEAGASKHGSVAIPAGSSVDMPFALGPSAELPFDVRYQGAPETAVELSVVDPSGNETPVPRGGDTTSSSVAVQAQYNVSSRSTILYVVTLRPASSSGNSRLTDGTYQLRLQNNHSSEVLVRSRLYAIDANMPYWTEHADDSTSVLSPGTADTAITVAGYAWNSPYLVQSGQRQPYSGIGPRLDGVSVLDVAAPTDHFTSYVHADPRIAGVLAPASGTSGAIPLVAGTLALLMQAEPDLTPGQLHTRIIESARTDDFTMQTPNAGWGHGKLSTYAALIGQEPQTNTFPIVEFVAQRDDGWITLDASDSYDGEDMLEQLTFRWDVDYDGIWDHVATGAPRWKFEPQRRTQDVVLQVEDTLGLTSSVIGRVARGSMDDAPVGGCGCQGTNDVGALVALLGIAIAYRRRRVFT